MIVLKDASDSVEVVLNAAHTTNPLRVFCGYQDKASGADREAVNTNGTTPVTVLTGPSDGKRVVDFINIYNSDTTTKAVTLRFRVSGTAYELVSVSLAPQETLQYTRQGFKVSTSSGSVKQSTVQGSNPAISGLNVGVLGSDVTNNNAIANTIADVTGLSFPVVAGNTYRFRFVIHFTSAATTTGSRWSISGPTTTQLSYRSQYSLTTTSETVNNGLGAYDLPAASNASCAATGQNIAIIEGIITPSADGNVIARFASEVASSAIVAKAKSYVEYQQV